LLVSNYKPALRNLHAWSPDTLSEVMSRHMGQAQPPPDLIVVIAGLNDLLPSFYQQHVPGTHHPPPTSVETQQKSAFYLAARAGLESIQSDLDREGTSRVLWAGMGRKYQIKTQLNAYHDYIKGKIGTGDWPDWLMYKCFVGRYMSHPSDFQPRMLDGQQVLGPTWHVNLAQARCKDLVEHIKNVMF
jgi:hypothetical protein